ncbi:Ribophorin I [Pseudomassariella vexata]|uniref:Dolichyl-diphosphooligosaccharide--protein glycosyltransferase subunit 1 n=1 Tax=Pseudomassariella vexata TaxID=1141098 RepID=A0A1Y2DDZ5_9PEZI|nr:Ribophorin I [Pseudomassariella vexata]ORY57488.1 Ribophorin I [Pseudomassariella vexata]
MKSIAAVATAFLSLLSPIFADPTNVSSTPVSKVTLPSTFKPPQVFKNANLVHILSLEKNFAKESINVLIENVSKEPQDEYFLPFTSEQMARVGGIEVKDRKNVEVTGFVVEAAEFDVTSDTQYYRIKLPEALEPKGQQTLGISFYYLKAYSPLPAAIEQADKQYLVYSFSAYCASAYPTSKQKTEVKLPSSDIPDYTKIAGSGDVKEFPQKQGSKLTYGPFTDTPAGAVSPAKVRYEFTRPVTHISYLERDVEVSHWGGNVAFEERYTLYNQGANLSALFNRVKWAQSQYYNPQSYALKEMKFPLRVGSKDAYFTDAIGNVSTSRFRSNKREAVLEIKPRYPIFGGWKYPFTIGWNADAKHYLRKQAGDSYILNVPFIEGPKQAEGAGYEQVQLRVFLPEGAENVKFYTTIPQSSITDHIVDLQTTYLDTIGRTVLTIRARNLPDEFRDRELIVSYDYSFFASLRKPLVIFGSMMVVFVGTWLISKIDMKFSTK